MVDIALHATVYVYIYIYIYIKFASDHELIQRKLKPPHHIPLRFQHKEANIYLVNLAQSLGKFFLLRIINIVYILYIVFLSC